MSHAEKCPVCGGGGMYQETDLPCHGCNGRGWVEIGDDYNKGQGVLGIDQIVIDYSGVYYENSLTGEISRA